MTLRQLGTNMTLLCFANKQILFSYETPVAAFVSGRGYLRTSKQHSRTTTKHVMQWLNGFHAEAVPQEAIDALCV